MRVRRLTARLVSVVCGVAVASACGAFTSTDPPAPGVTPDAAPVEGGALSDADAGCVESAFERCDAGGGRDADPTCTSPEVGCYEGTNRVCVNRATNLDHCGACGNRCAYRGAGACTAGDCVSVVFVTKGEYGGNLGGLAGADKICDDTARKKFGNRKFRAWLSMANEHAGTRLDHPGRRRSQPLVRPDGEIIAMSWTSFAQSNHLMPINRDEAGALVVGARVWTGTAFDGNYDMKGDCAGWTSLELGLSATAGDASGSNTNWTDDGTSACNLLHHIYCVQD